MDDGVQLIIVRSKVREMTGQIFGRKWFPDESDFIESQEARTCTKTWDAASPRSFHRAGVQQVRQYRLIRPLSARHNSGRWPFRKRAQQYRSSRGMHSAHHLLSFLPLFAIPPLVCRFHRSNYPHFNAIRAPFFFFVCASALLSIKQFFMSFPPPPPPPRNID